MNMRWLPALPALAAALAAGAGEPGGSAAPEPFEYAVATVNGRPITRSFLALRVGKSLREMERERDARKAKGQWTARDDEQFAQVARGLELNAVRGVVFGEILRAEAQKFVKLGFTVPEREVERHWRRLLEQAGGPARLAEEQGLSVAALREAAKDDILAEAYRQNMRSSEAKPTPQEVADYYRFHSEVLRRRESVRAQAIFIRRFAFDEKTGAKDERTTARQRAEDLLARLKAGADFAQLARRYSEDPKSAAGGGMLGSEEESYLVGRGDFEPRVEEALFGGKPGELSGVVEGPANFYIVKVLRHLPAGVPPIEEIEAEVFARCYAERVRAAEERVFRESFKKVLLLDARGQRVTLENIWPSRREQPAKSLFNREEEEG
jgi:parvulin-like peptidyl-prolyl isomerase